MKNKRKDLKSSYMNIVYLINFCVAYGFAGFLAIILFIYHEALAAETTYAIAAIAIGFSFNTLKI